MSYTFSPEVTALIQQHMATGRYRSEDDLLRDALERLIEETVEDDDDDWAAIREGLEEVDRGEPGMSVDEAFRWILERHPHERRT
jgi:Arc/MetJ-type ribon-helix-helix transcriptional regulator